MKMKRILSIALAFVLAATVSFAQTTQKEYKDRYDNLVSRVGVAGLGVETLISHWEEAYPDDVEMLLAKFYYKLSKSQTSTIDTLNVSKYLGNSPTITLKDSTGRMVNYFQIFHYDDEVFGEATKAIDKAIELNPLRLDLRFYKISALIGYEKESPDMAMSALNTLIDYNYSQHPKWEYPGLEMDDETFSASIQEYCYTFFKMGTPGTFEAFRSLSEKMQGYDPSNPVFMTNLGSYYLVYAQDDKAALKIYNKVLKKNPTDYTTIKNCVLLARKEKNVKLEKKYLAMLAQVTPDPTEKASAEARLKGL